jgi:hypothetical protein
MCGGAHWPQGQGTGDGAYAVGGAAISGQGTTGHKGTT